MPDGRPDPEALLASLREQEATAKRAKLKIFLGASAGVGKTYAMLVEAHERRRAGADVVVGLVETHGRRETQALLEGLELLPRRSDAHRGVTLTEFDLDAALARRPALLLLDELAHTNAPGSRHRRRWQDVQELLEAGIDVATTLNVQHVESLVDVVAQITGVTVRETVPDSILDRADEIEVVDLPPDDLLQRLREGKVYVPQQAERAAEGFFRKGNLIALRELALRQTAQRVDAQMESYRRAAGIAEPWAVRERLLVCLGDGAQGLRLVRAARRMAAALKAEWIVAHVETPAELRDSRGKRDALVDVMGLAEELGAEAVMLTGLRAADEILAFARARHVSRLVLGKPGRPRWQEWLGGSLVSEVLRRSGGLDVHVLAGEDEQDAREPVAVPTAPAAPRWRGYAGVAPVVAACSLLASFAHGRIDLSNIVMIYLLGVVVVAMAFGRGPAILASLVSVALFDFWFVPPHLTFAVSDTQYLITFVVMLVVAATIGTLTARMREQTIAARTRERRTAALYQLSRELSARRTREGLLDSAVTHIRDVFGARAAILRPDAAGRLAVAAGDRELLDSGAHEMGVAQWALDHGQPAGHGTPTLPASHALHLPLVVASGTIGVLSVRGEDMRRFADPEQRQLLQTFANQAAVALERAELAERAERSRVETEAERARNALLSSVSHDLRTPLAVITGAATGLRDAAHSMSEETRAEMADTIATEAQRLNRLVGELLDMTRLEAGALTLRREWHSLLDVVGGTLVRLERSVPGRRVTLDAPPDLPLVPLDDVLMGQAVHNLVENALQACAPEGHVAVALRVAGDALEIEVCDDGPGLAPGEAERVFDKFYRGGAGRDRRGAGLGLTICRGIVEAHGGRIVAGNRDGGGARFLLRLPLPEAAPEVDRTLDAEDPVERERT
ncbi:MAG: sensor histidine kinase KdpD [Candidatus Eisenbacteria bacterium]|uniref:histidine kinase n=1 Tax=Eiseniibacteriota bacterium TaxID=2212470 RepID=A0A933SGF8_UNCEI|nr:sensor histidine kinase KdpD [Candidatus Eisenbacteria bacterium]